MESSASIRLDGTVDGMLDGAPEIIENATSGSVVAVVSARDPASSVCSGAGAEADVDWPPSFDNAAIDAVEGASFGDPDAEDDGISSLRPDIFTIARTCDNAVLSSRGLSRSSLQLYRSDHLHDLRSKSPGARLDAISNYEQSV